MAQAGEVAAASLSEAVQFAKTDNRRMLHVVYRVGDLDKTIKFYTECLGMKLLRKRDIPEEKYSNAFLGYGAEDSHFVVELTYSTWGKGGLGGNGNRTTGKLDVGLHESV